MDMNVGGGGPGGPQLDPKIDTGGPGPSKGPSPGPGGPAKDSIGNDPGSLFQGVVDKWNATNPHLQINIGSLSSDSPADLVRKWMQATPLTSEVESFNDMATEMTKSSLLTQLMMGISIELIGQLYQQDKDQILASAKADMMMDIAGAIAGAMTLAFSIASLGVGAKLRSEDAGEATITSTTQAIQQGGSAIGGIIENSMKAYYTLQKGDADAMKVLTDGQTQIAQKVLDSQTDAKKTMEDLISQLEQTLSKMAESLLAKHTFSLHG